MDKEQRDLHVALRGMRDEEAASWTIYSSLQQYVPYCSIWFACLQLFGLEK
jgi:hypothetical protein